MFFVCVAEGGMCLCGWGMDVFVRLGEGCVCVGAGEGEVCLCLWGWGRAVFV